MVLPAVINALLPINNTDFSYGHQSYSQGGGAVCMGGILKVQVTATNSKILLSAPSSNPAVTELYVEFTQVNSKLATKSIGGSAIVTGTYGISSKLCLPADAALAEKVKTVQVLTHGGTLDNTYWDIAPGYSYISEAVAAGYATFSYDRLGTGFSDHPDPLQIVQLPIQVEIAHFIVQKLRSSGISGHSFEKVVGVGHSLGSAITQSVAAKYHQDFDALILQGTSTFFDYAFTGLASEAPQIANRDPTGLFKNLPDGYHTPSPLPETIQFAFYRYPGFNPIIFASQMARKQTNALGEMFTLGAAYAPATAFTGPVDIVNGENDYFYCGGDCTFPTNQAAAAIRAYFPAASNGSESYLAPIAGHNVNAHYSAQKAFKQMLAFLGKNGIR
ncbi:MAG: hypothetical protein Q9163_005159 [Psora crenata]